MLRCSRVLRLGCRHKTDASEYYKILNVRKNSSLKEITLKYFDLAKIHHPDHGGDEEVFRSVHKAYRELKKLAKGAHIELIEAELSSTPPPQDAIQFFGDAEDDYWQNKKAKIRALLGEQKFAVKGKDSFYFRMTNLMTNFFSLRVTVIVFSDQRSLDGATNEKPAFF